MSLYSDQWRLHFTAGYGGSYYQIVEVAMSGSAGGVDLCVGGVASASSEVNSGNADLYAFDNDINTKWMSSVQGTQWLQYTFAAPVRITEYSIMGPFEEYNYSPKTWSLQRLDNGVWVDADIRVDEAIFGSREVRVYQCNSLVQLYEIATLCGCYVSGIMNPRAPTVKIVATAGVLVSGVLASASGMSVEGAGAVLVGGTLNIHTGYSFATDANICVDGGLRLPVGLDTACGVIIGGGALFRSAAHHSTTGGIIIGATMLKTQIPCDLYAPAAITFSLTDASINFKLEVSP